MFVYIHILKKECRWTQCILCECPIYGGIFDCYDVSPFAFETPGCGF